MPATEAFGAPADLKGFVLNFFRKSFLAAAIAALIASVLWAVPASAATCPCNLLGNATPTTANDTDNKAVELGLKFSSDTPGVISGIRFYKGSKNIGTHVGRLWTSTGSLLATVTFTNETASGWQTASFSSPVAIQANTTYVASYSSPKYYSSTQNYFATKKDVPPLHAPVGAGVYKYGPSGTFPNQSYKNSNYWVDVIFNTTTPTDTTAPTVTSVTPAADAVDIGTATTVSATFSEAVTGISNTTFTLTNSSGQLAATVGYDSATRVATLTPAVALAAGTTFTATVKGGAQGVKDVAGNALATDRVWSFTTATATPPPPPPPTTSAKPILLVTTNANPFTTYYTEILKGEGLNQYETLDIASLSAPALAAHSAVVLGEMPLTAAQVSLLGEYVGNGGDLIVMRPDKQLSGLLGLTDAGTTLSNQYLKLSSNSTITAGITQQTMQFHGTADQYSLNGATALATLYANSSTATSFPAVTIKAVGSNGGQVAAFTYDLAKSVVYTRQGNPAWAGQNRSGGALKRANDMFYGNASFDPQPDWVNLDKVQIPQADEQQHVFANLLTQMTLDKAPLPKFWFLPNGKKAAVVMTGDDHDHNGTTPRFQEFEALSPAGCNVANWECVRGTSYVYPGTDITQANAQDFTSKGFELGVHVSTSCSDVTPSQYNSIVASEIAAFQAAFPGVPAPVTNRNHCIAWSDWNSVAQVESAHGIRLDTNYYYFPPEWVQNRPGLFTGSGQVLKFANPDGTIVDNYQAATQLTDESGQTYPFTPNTLLDNAVGPLGYYAILTANHHTDVPTEVESTTTVQAALARGIPVVSAKQMLNWLDGRNASSFSNVAMTGNTLSFDVNVGNGAQNLIRAMVPVRSSNGVLTAINSGASNVAYTVETIKGVEYAFFAATNASYTATYVADASAPTVVSTTPASGAADVAPTSSLTATFSEAIDPSTVNANTVSATSGTNSIAGTVSYESNARVARFTPSQSLPLGSTVTFTVKGGTSGIRDLSGLALAADVNVSFTTAAVSSATIFGTTVPTTPSVTDTGAYTLGVKFRSDVDALVTGVRFYKGPSNTGTHVGSLWSSSGQLLASGTFVNETSGGWQTLTFASPVAIAANTTYVASYTVPNGGYAADYNGLATQVDSGTLHALASGASGGNGVFASGSSNTFPTSSYQASNYWVDVVVSVGAPPADTTPPAVTTSTPSGSSVATNTALTATFSETVDASTVNANNVTLATTAGGTPVAGTVSYDAATRTATFTPTAALATATGYTATVVNVKDVAGNTMTSAHSWTFTTAAAPPSGNTASLFTAGFVPASVATNDSGAVELGMKFSTDVAGSVTAIRFYKTAVENVDRVNLWSSSGTLLATASVAASSATGWQTITLASPVALNPGTTYVASYHTTNGNYAYDSGYFNSERVSTPLRAPSSSASGGNGVYTYGSGGFPTSSFNAASYSVDLVLSY